MSNGGLAGVAVGGTVGGGAGQFCGIIESRNDMGPGLDHPRPARRVGLPIASGCLRGKLASPAVGGSLIGGPEEVSGFVNVIDLGAVRVGHDVVGDSVTGPTCLRESEVIQCTRRIGGVMIGGSITAGINDATGDLFDCATVPAGDDIGAPVVRGGIVGSDGPQGDGPVVISARGQAAPRLTTDLAIGRITVAAGSSSPASWPGTSSASTA